MILDDTFLVKMNNTSLADADVDLMLADASAFRFETSLKNEDKTLRPAESYICARNKKYKCVKMREHFHIVRNSQFFGL